MENPIKNIIAHHNLENRDMTLTKLAYNNLKSDVSNFFWIKKGYESPHEVLNCWSVNEKDRIESINTNRPFSENYSSTEYFKIINRIDNNFIEGYLGRDDQERSFHDKLELQYTYFSDYKERKKIYFTFDKISLYEVIEILPKKP